jgi:acetate kinase
MADAILTLNAGSSSIKFALFARSNRDIPAAGTGRPDRRHRRGRTGGPHQGQGRRRATLDDSDLELDVPGKTPHQAALGLLVDWLHGHEAGWSIAGVGHRVVHGAQKFSQPVVLDAAMVDALRGFIPLAPLHQPHNLAGIDALGAALPGVPQVACFDTAFHRSQPELAQLFALPRAITAEGVRRYGFHGLSYEYIAEALPRHIAPAQARGRVIVAHLGNGASMCAMHDLKSQASTMGFTAVDGLMMGTRTGNLDPGVLLYLMDYRGMGSRELTQLLYKESGLLGVSGISQDMRILLESSAPEATRGGGPVLLPHPARNRLAGRGAGRARRTGVHRRHRRTRRGGARKGVRRPRLARRLPRPGRQCGQRDPNFRRGQPDRRLRDTH